MVIVDSSVNHAKFILNTRGILYYFTNCPFTPTAKSKDIPFPGILDHQTVAILSINAVAVVANGVILNDGTIVCINTVIDMPLDGTVLNSRCRLVVVDPRPAVFYHCVFKQTTFLSTLVSRNWISPQLPADLKVWLEVKVIKLLAVPSAIRVSLITRLS